LAGFEVTLIGRFWVTPEVIHDHDMIGPDISHCEQVIMASEIVGGSISLIR
jgi:hypothetical protein